VLFCARGLGAISPDHQPEMPRLGAADGTTAIGGKQNAKQCELWTSTRTPSNVDYLHIVRLQREGNNGAMDKAIINRLVGTELQ